ncbi:MAG: SPOR domain-containing protein [Legionella sp.]|nr:SPOR domain-containing protein [Legionella sp.]
MKLVLDERVKHRLIGLAVIISIAAIFTPAMVRKSNQKLDEQTQLSIHIPPKPTLPRIVMPDEEAMFKQTKITHLEIPAPPEKPALVLAKAAPLHAANDDKSAKPVTPAPETLPKANVPEKKIQDNTADNTTDSHSIPVPTPQQPPSPGTKMSTPTPPPSHSAVVKVANVQKKSQAHIKHNPHPEKLSKAMHQKMTRKSLQNGYGIQVASFVKQKNAIALTAKLRAQGYRTAYQTIHTQIGPRYKVIVGQVPQKEQAKLLQKQLASSLQLNGLIISGVS